MRRKINNKDKKKNDNKLNKPVATKRLKIMMLALFVVFLSLMIRIGWLQFVQGAELKEAASRQQTTNIVISPKRGTVYDTNGTALAISASVDTVSVNPSKIEDEDKELVAKALAEIFELEYETVLEQVKNDSSVETIAKKVEQDKIEKLEAWMKENKITVGINIDEDSKRYYPYSNLASRAYRFYRY